MHSRRRSPALAAALLAAACASTPRPPSPPPSPAAAPAPTRDEQASAQQDRSPVPAPEGLLATVRIPSPRSSARRLSQHFGIGDQLVELLDGSLPDVFHRDQELSSAINLEEPIDIALLRGARGALEVTVAFSAGPYAEVAGRLGDGHTLEVEGPPQQGVRRITRRQGTSLPCALAPNGANPGVARIVCAERWEHVTRAVDYLTRTLPATPVAREEAEVLVEAASDSLRAALREDVRRASDRLATDAIPRADPNNPAFEAAARQWLQEAVGMIPQLLDELGVARATITLPDEGLRVEGSAQLTRVASEVMRRWLDAVARPDARAELMARLPPGAMVYASGSASLEPLRATMNLAAMGAARALVPRTRMSLTESTILRTAVSALFAQDRVGGATSIGLDAEGRYWNVSLFEPSTPGLQFVANARQLVATCKRPLVARAIRADHQVDPMRWRLRTAPGLPRGSLYLSIPPGQFLWSGTARSLFGDLSRQPMEVLLVPDGPRVWYVAAPDALARYRAASAAHDPPVALSAGLADGAVGVAAVMPIAASLLFGDDAQFRRNLAGLLQRTPDHGSTPLTLRVAQQNEGDGVRFSTRVLIPRAVLGIVGQVMSTLSGAGSRAPSP